MIPTLVVLFGTFAVVLAIERWGGRDGATRRAGRIALAVLFAFTGVSHFILTEGMAEMVPPPLPPVPTVLATGVFEILGAAGLMVPRTQRTAAWCLFSFLVAVFPANVYAALQHTGLGGHIEGPSYLLRRGPLQLLFLTWTWYFGIRGSR
ncbi:MAG TPA: DoxX family membrane protein [Vicinamibacteria bacterium]|nr:DoxX family membrane protein [Vicinamibacteria bacterium]